MIKKFSELVALDVSASTSKKPVFTRDKATNKLRQTGTLDYLNWADCLVLLHENGAENVQFGNVRSEKDHPVFLLDGGVPFVRVYVDIDGDRRELDYPIIDGSKDIAMDKMAQSDVHNATQRAFVKCVAINWGLGLRLWQKQEDQEEKDKQIDVVEISNIYAIKERIERIITAKLQAGMEMEDVYSVLGLNQRAFNKLMVSFQNIDVLEQKLKSL